jgi:hypothetical protein
LYPAVIVAIASFLSVQPLFHSLCYSRHCTSRKRSEHLFSSSRIFYPSTIALKVVQYV